MLLARQNNLQIAVNIRAKIAGKKLELSSRFWRTVMAMEHTERTRRMSKKHDRLTLEVSLKADFQGQERAKITSANMAIWLAVLVSAKILLMGGEIIVSLATQAL